MKFNAKKLLLAGTAVMAVGTFAAVNAQAADLTTSSSVVFASSGGQTSANVSNAKAGDNVDFTGNGTLTVENNSVSNDGSGVNTFNVGAVTDSPTFTGNLTVQNGLISGLTPIVADLTVNIASVNLDGNVLIANRDADNSANTTTFTGASTIGGTLNVTNNESSAAKVVALDVNSDLTVTGVTTLTAGTFNGANSTLNVFGNATFTGGVVLNDDASGAVTTLTFDGTSAQTVAGAISGAVGNEGAVVVANAAGVTFSGNLGGTALKTITINNGTSNSSATFKGTVVNATSGIVLGSGAGTDTNTVTFDATAASQTVTGAITGGSAGETNNIVIEGGDTTKSVTLASAVGGGGNIDNVTVNASSKLITSSTLAASNSLVLGSGAIFSAGGTVTAPTITLGSGSTLSTDGAATLTGSINGAGTLDINQNTTVVGNIGNSTVLTALTVATTKTLIIDANTFGANATVAASNITLENGGTLTLTPGARTITVANDIATDTDAVGTVTITAGTGTINFSGDVGQSTTKSLAALTIGTGSTNVVNAHGDLFVDATTIGAGSTLNLLASNGVVSGTIDGNGGAGRGAIVVGDGVATSATTFNSAIGTTTNTVNSFTVKTAATGNISKNASVTGADGALGVLIDGTLNVDSTSNTVALTTADGNLDINGKVAVTGVNSVTMTANDTLSVDGSLSTVLGGTNKTLTLTSTANTLTVGTAADTTVSASNQIILGTTAATIGANGRVNTLSFSGSSDFNPDTTTVVDGSAATVTFAAGSVLNVTTANAGNILANGATVTVLTTGGGTNITTALGDGRIVLVDSGLIDLSDDTSTATALKVNVAYRDANAVFTGDDTVGGGAANSLMAFSGATGELQTIRNSLGTSNATQAQEIAESISPTVDGGNVTAAMDVSNSVFGVASTRLASLKEGQSGMAAGSMPAGSHTWGQVFGQSANQDQRNGVDGYDSRTGGIALGGDAEAMDGSGHLGAALSYANTNVDSDNANTTETDIDSYQITAYGDMDLQNDLYLSGMAAYAFNDNTTERHNVGGIAGLTADGDFNAHQFAARAELGRPYAMEGGLVLTPSVMANYMYYNAEDFTETGAGTANLNVNQDSVSRLDLGVGIDAGWTFQNADGSFLKPSVNAGYRYDVIGDDISTTSSFTGGGAAFETEGLDPAQSQFNVGAAVKYMTVNNWDFTAQYDYQFKSDYDAHNGILRAAYKF